MIGRLHGILVHSEPPWIVVDVQGVGYELQVPLSTLWQLPPAGQQVTIHTQLIVREDAQLLYGFYDKPDKVFFNQLIKISGIGPKVALAILSGLTVGECQNAIQAQDVGVFTRVPGIGKKTAERLIVEMQDKCLPVQVQLQEKAPASAKQEAIAALIALGYKPKEAQKALANITADDTQSMIKAALQGLATT